MSLDAGKRRTASVYKQERERAKGDPWDTQQKNDPFSHGSVLSRTLLVRPHHTRRCAVPRGRSARERFCWVAATAISGSPVTGASPGAGTPRRSGDEPLPSPLPPPSCSAGLMSNLDTTAVPAGQTEATASVAFESDDAFTAVAEETAAAAEAAAVAVSARAASAAI